MRLLKRSEVLARTDLSNTTLWRLETRGEFPSRRQVSDRRVAWVESEVEAWLKKRKKAGVIPASRR